MVNGVEIIKKPFSKKLKAFEMTFIAAFWYKVFCRVDYYSKILQKLSLDCTLKNCLLPPSLPQIMKINYEKAKGKVLPYTTKKP